MGAFKMNINNIATLASKQKKPNKEKAFNTLKDIIKTGADDEKLATLYSFFIPPIPAKSKTLEHWVAKALAKKDIRDYLKYLYVTKGIMVATDGHRLHCSPINLDDGFYNSQLSKIDVNYNYPDIRRVIPNEKDMTRFNGELMLSDKEGLSVYKLEDVYIQKTYFDDAMSGITEPEIYLHGSIDQVLIKDRNSARFAVVMPIKI